MLVKPIAAERRRKAASLAPIAILVACGCRSVEGWSAGARFVSEVQRCSEGGWRARAAFPARRAALLLRPRHPSDLVRRLEMQDVPEGRDEGSGLGRSQEKLPKLPGGRAEERRRGTLQEIDCVDTSDNDRGKIRIFGGYEVDTTSLALAFLVVWQTISILFHHYVDKMPFLEAFFFSVDTGLSIGFGTINVDNDLSRMFNIVHVLVGAGAAGALLGLFADSVLQASEDNLANEMEKLQLKRDAKDGKEVAPPPVKPTDFDKRELVPGLLLAAWFMMGSIYGMELEGWTPIQSLYFAITALSTGKPNPPSALLPPQAPSPVAVPCPSALSSFAGDFWANAS